MKNHIYWCSRNSGTFYYLILQVNSRSAVLVMDDHAIHVISLLSGMWEVGMNGV